MITVAALGVKCRCLVEYRTSVEYSTAKPSVEKIWMKKSAPAPSGTCCSGAFSVDNTRALDRQPVGPPGAHPTCKHIPDSGDDVLGGSANVRQAVRETLPRAMGSLGVLRGRPSGAVPGPAVDRLEAVEGSEPVRVSRFLAFHVVPPRSGARSGGGGGADLGRRSRPGVNEVTRVAHPGHRTRGAAPFCWRRSWSRSSWWARRRSAPPEASGGCAGRGAGDEGSPV